MSKELKRGIQLATMMMENATVNVMWMETNVILVNLAIKAFHTVMVNFIFFCLLKKHMIFL